MTIIPVGRLTPHELKQLGNNTPAAVRADRRRDREAINRSLAIHDEQVGDDDPIVEAAIGSEHVAS
jgi:hypothetical protein